jgi:hypothetical protein
MRQGFQFSLGKMLRATSWFAVVCVAFGGLYRTSNEQLVRDVYRTRMVAYTFLSLVSVALTVTTLTGLEREGYLAALWMLVLLVATLWFFILVDGSRRRLRLTMPKRPASEQLGDEGP